tara:strand:+ start:953 stop:1813 length:861 start_codon:yes stop_codon:yes gene_type:complete
MINLSELRDLLSLEKIKDNNFIGQNYKTEWGRVFGGQVLGQSLYAAYQTVPEDRIAHSMHGYFILGGDINIPINYQVDDIRDGKSFTTRRVVAFQKGKAIFNMAASFQLDQDGVNHQISMPNVLTPELLLTDLQQAIHLKEIDPKRYEKLLKSHPQVFEFKPIEKATFLKTRNSLPKSHVWFKTKEKFKTTIPFQHQLLAFASDYSLLLTATLPHREKLFGKKIFYASLDHAIWFHRKFKIDEWLLYSMQSPSASNSRGFTNGSIFNEKGEMVASVSQEGLIRTYK